MRRLFGLLCMAILACSIANAIPTPKVFIGNSGQWPSHVLYGAQTADGFVWITTTGLIVDQRAMNADGMPSSHLVQLDVLESTGSRHTSVTRDAHAPVVQVIKPGASVMQTTASTVVVHDVLRGIDLEYVWDGDRVRYNILADPGVAIPDPFFMVKGAKDIRTNDGAIEITTDLGAISMSGIVAFQQGINDARTVEINSTTRSIGFRVDDVRTTSPLTIDPIVYATAIHGSADEEITSMRVNKDGNVVVGGWTTSADIVTPSGTANGGRDGFVAILTPNLATVLSWAYIGGDSADAVRSIAVASNGQIWATGETNSPGLPFPSSAISGSYSGTVDGFVVRFSPNLGTLMNGMYIAGNGTDLPMGISVGPNNEVAVCGQTGSTSGMPTGPGYSATPILGNDGFVLALAADGSFVEAFTYFGGQGSDAFTTVVHDKYSNIVVGGWTASNEYKTWPEKTLIWIPPDDEKGSEGYYEEVGENPYDVEYNGGSTDGVLTKFSNIGALIFSTYFGGKDADVINSVVCDADADIHAVGTTRSSDLPLPDGSSQPFGGQSDAFVSVISKDGLRLVTCHYLGGAGADEGLGAAIDKDDNVFVTGSSNSPDLQAVGAGATSSLMGGLDGFLAKVNLESVLFNSLFGWTGDDIATTIALDSHGDVFVGGRSTSTFPTVIGKKSGSAVQADAIDAFVAKQAFGTVSMQSPAAGTVLCGGKVINITWLTQDMPSTENYNVDVSGDGGQTWTPIATNVRSRNTSWTAPETAPPAGTYRFRVRTLRGHAALSSAYEVGVAPLIVEQPNAAWICPGSSHELRVNAGGEAITYQWYMNGLPISGATTNVLEITSATSNDAGDYHVVLTSNCGSTTSASAAVTVAPAPVITQQPQSTSLEPGRDLTLTVAADGPSLTYQWQFNNANIPAPVGTQATLVIPSVTAVNGGVYRCIITSTCGNATSEEATVDIVLSVDEEGSAGLAFVMAPQPASENVTLTLTDGSVISAVTLRDMHGRVVAYHTINDAASTTLPLSALSIGTYWITVQSSNGLFTRPIMIQR